MSFDPSRHPRYPDGRWRRPPGGRKAGDPIPDMNGALAELLRPILTRNQADLKVKRRTL